MAHDDYDYINPAHYKGFSNGAETIDIVENLTYNRGAAVKYLARGGNKPGEDTLRDLNKALWYVQREISRLEKAARTAEAPAKAAPNPRRAIVSGSPKLVGTITALISEAGTRGMTQKAIRAEVHPRQRKALASVLVEMVASGHLRRDGYRYQLTP